MRLSRAGFALAQVVALLLVTVASWSQPSSRAEAAARFDEGRKAFDAGDFRRAADAFEAAYHLAPNVDVLWNAARAWQRAGEAAHAATLYSRYLRDAPPGAADRATATAELSTLSRKLARIEVHGEELADLKLDDAPSEDRVVYVSRGAHVVSATVKGRLVRKDAQVEAGDVVSVVFEDQVPVGAPGAAVVSPAPTGTEAHVDRIPEAVPAAASVRAPSTHKTWSPWVFVTGAALTSVALGFTIASGVDTDHALTLFEAHSNMTNLSSGQAKQLRTNVLLGSTLGLGVATAAVGIWLIDWRGGGQRVQVGLEPPRGAVRWTF
jgi:tetratricopeptide (TPR) repeat protein